MSDHELNHLIARCKKKDKNAFSQLVEMYKAPVFRMANRILFSSDEANDVIQDTFLKVWLNIKSYRGDSKFTSWLYQIVTNLCIDRIRKQQLSERYSNEVSNDVGYSAQEPSNELLRLATEIAKELPPIQRICFVLRDLEDREMNEIAAYTKLSTNQVKSNVYYARKKVREKLETVYKYQP